MKKMRTLVIVILLSLFSIGIIGCETVNEKAAPIAENDEEMHLEAEEEMLVAVNVDSSVTVTDLQCVWMNRSQFWGGLVFQGLLIADGNIANVKPDLCEEYIISPDGKKYVFILKNNVYWHDGQKLTAEDVVWSIETSTITPQMNGYIQKGIKSIKGVAEYQEGKADSISGISVEGNAITIELLEKDGQFLASIAQLAILPKHCFTNTPMEELNASEFWKQPVGSGPYKVDIANDGTQALFVVNPHYTGKIPKIKKIRYKILENPESDDFDFTMTSDPVTVNKFMSNPKYEVVKTSNLYYRYLIMNLDGRTGERAELLQKNEVRQALVLALDRNQILKTVYGEAAIGIDGGIPASDSWYVDEKKETLKYNPVQAKQILEAAGFDFEETVVLTRYHQDDMSVKLLEEIAKYWNAVGIKTRIEPIDATQTDKLWINTDWYDIGLKNLSAVDYTEWYYEYSSENQLWNVILNRKEFDPIINTLNIAAMAKEKNKLYAGIQRLESELVYKIPICILPQYVIYNKEHIQIPDMEFPNMWYYFDLDIADWKFNNK